MENQEVREIIEYLKKDDLSERNRIDAIRGLGDTGAKEAFYILIDMLEKFDLLSWKERNAIALSIGDLGFDEGASYLMNVAKNPKYDGYSGSFLYALTIKPLNCREFFLDIIELLCNGDLEIRESAIILIEKFYRQISPEIIKKSLEILLSQKILLEYKSKGSEKYGALGFIEHAQDLLT